MNRSWRRTSWPRCGGQFAGQILPIIIHEHEVLREAASFGQPVLEYAPESKARADFEALADWLEEHAARPTVQIEVMPAIEALGLGQEAMLPIRHDARGPDGERPAAPIPAHSQCPAPSLDPGSRAAELVRRVHQLTARDHGARARGRADPGCRDGSAGNASARCTGSVEPAVIEPKIEPALSHAIEVQALAAAVEQPTIVHLYGVRKTSQAFCSYNRPTARTAWPLPAISITGPPVAMPMRFNTS
jgi:hypothetical protein